MSPLFERLQQRFLTDAPDFWYDKPPVQWWSDEIVGPILWHPAVEDIFVLAQEVLDER